MTAAVPLMAAAKFYFDRVHLAMGARRLITATMKLIPFSVFVMTL